MIIEDNLIKELMQDDYIVVVERENYTLQRRYKSKDGEIKTEAQKWFSTPIGLLRYLLQCAMANNADTVTLTQFMEKQNEIWQEIHKSLGPQLSR